MTETAEEAAATETMSDLRNLTEMTTETVDHLKAAEEDMQVAATGAVDGLLMVPEMTT